MSETNKAKMLRFYDEVFQKGHVDLIDEMAAPGFVDHQPAPGQPPGREGIKQFVTAMRMGLSHVQVTVEHAIAEGDFVATHLVIRGTHTGDLMGMPPSGKEVAMRVSDLVRFENGQAAERWGVEDMSGLMPHA